ncbi:MAG TPA: hypothetical protein P5123_01400 [Spirochaetota bacterium]|nr:hypothetical protein [Spirochaetota bacterium]
MNSANAKEKRKQERLKKWSSCLIRNNEVIAGKEITNNNEPDIDRCLSQLHELRRMAWPELDEDYRMEKSIAKIIRPS